MDYPRVFFSYSLTKTCAPTLVRDVIARLQKKVTDKNWEVVDPLKKPDIESIRGKVDKSLWRSDAAIVEVTTNSPNIMVEVGFARALAYPCIFLVNKSVYSDPSLKEYFGFLKLDDRNPLSADLGDIEYLVYPASTEDKNEWDQFEKKADSVFEVFQELLSPEAILVKRAAKEILARSSKFVATHSNTHPIIGFVGGRLSMLARGFDVLGDNVFETDARHYSGSLAAYLSSEPSQSLQVRAIADRSSDVETFWGKKPDRLPVAERLFLVDWSVFFKREQFEKLHQLLQDETDKKYSVRLGVKSVAMSGKHILGEKAIGQDLLLVEPDLVGGYVEDPPGNILRVEKNKDLYRDGAERYEGIRKRTLKVQSGMSVSALRREWLELNGIGRWDPDWGEPDSRPNSYFDSYDQHIRCWIPDYENLIKHCAVLTQAAISQRMRETNRPMHICEIGYGTGELSESLLSWMDNLNAPVEAVHRPPVISTFLGIDSARRMQEFASRRFAGKKSSQVFDVCTAPTWSRTVREYVPFDMMCGSLVLHDMVADTNVVDKMVEVLGKFAPVMSRKGLLIFADVFFSDEANERALQLDKWKKYMRWMGMSHEEIEVFFSNNPELIDTLTMSKIKAVEQKSKFDLIDLSAIPASESFPLRVLILQNREE